MSAPILEIAAIRKRFANLQALKGVSLSVSAGELFGLLGPNGAGKTTLLSIVGGLMDADEGQVCLQGKPFTRSTRQLRPWVGLGTQDLAVYPDLTARENIEFFGKLYGMRGTKLRERADELLMAVGLQDRVNDRAGTFSGGMKRRLNLAVAVVHSPKLLLLDEPTTGVDPQSRNLIFEIVRKLNSEGMTIVYTSHYMEEVQALCTRIAVIDGGRVVACDTLGNLLQLHSSSLTINVPQVSTEFVERLRRLPGVSEVTTKEGAVCVRTHAIAPLLPLVARECHDLHVSPTAMETNEPTLEKVFLQLTGRALRD